MGTLTPDLIVDGLQPAEPRLSPDGTRVAFVAAPVGRTGEHAAGAIWLAPADGSAPARKLTSDRADDRHPRWATDGRSLFFLSDRQKRGSRAEIHKLPLDGGEPEPVTDWNAKIAAFAPLPNGTTVAFLAPDPKSDDERRRDDDRDDADVFGQWRPHRLRLLDLATGAVRTVDALGDRHVHRVDPAPDGRRLAVVTWSTPELDAGMRAADLRVVDLATGEAVTVCPLPGGVRSLAWDPAGDLIGFVAHRHPAGRGALALFAVPPAPAEPTCLTDGLAACPTDLWAGSDGDVLLLIADGFDTTLNRVDLRSGTITPERRLTGPASDLHSSADGQARVVLWSDPTRPTDVWTIGRDAAPVPVSHLRPELDAIAWGGQRRVRWSAPDGLAIDGLLILPPGATERDGPFPTMTLVHGGPYGRWADQLNLGWGNWGQWLATAGYAVLLPNPRGGLGRGDAFADTVTGAVGREDWHDVLAGVNHVVAAGIADPDRLGIGGWSQGGFMTAWAVGQTSRFKLGIMGAGVSDWGMMVAESDLQHFEQMLGGSAGWEGVGPHQHDALSPISFAHRVATPVLVLHGANDERVPASQGRFFARALRELGVPFELVAYPREPHAIRERAHQRDLLQRVRAWTERWLGAGWTKGA